MGPHTSEKTQAPRLVLTCPDWTAADALVTSLGSKAWPDPWIDHFHAMKVRKAPRISPWVHTRLDSHSRVLHCIL